MWTQQQSLALRGRQSFYVKQTIFFVRRKYVWYCSFYFLKITFFRREVVLSTYNPVKPQENENITFRMKGGRTMALMNCIQMKTNGKGSFRTIYSRIFILKYIVPQLHFVTLERFYLCRPICNNNIHVVFRSGGSLESPLSGHIASCHTKVKIKLFNVRH